MESGIVNISVPYQIYVVKLYGFRNRFFFIYLILIFLLSTNHDFRIETTFIQYVIFCTSQKMIYKNLVELPINTTFDLKFSCSTGDEWNPVYNKNNNNFITINQ